MRDGADISAVLLSTGEASTARARASIEAQEPPLAQIVTVHNVAPFHRALSQGANQVRSEFFVQVDADMILDCDCVARLGAFAEGHVGVVLGHLRDPLYGRVQAIKLWRTAPLRELGFPDSVSPDTDFIETLRRAGLVCLHALRFGASDPAHWHTFGEHRPDYDPAQIWQKHLRDGRRLRYRGRVASVRYHLRVLHTSGHRNAMLAKIALANGFFLDWTRDRQGTLPADDGWLPVAGFLAAAARVPDPVAVPGRAFRSRGLFGRAYRAGWDLGRRGDGDGFLATVEALQSGGASRAWISELALCRGVTAALVGAATPAADWEKLRTLLSDREWNTTPPGIGGRARTLLRRLRGR